MSIVMVDTVRRGGAQEEFLKQLGMRPGNGDAERLCRAIQLIDQAKGVNMGPDWEIPTVTLLKATINRIARANGLAVVYSDTDSAFVKIGKIPMTKDETIRLIGANVWEW